MATPKYNKERGLWILDARKNGKRKVFYSKISGIKGKREVMAQLDDWLEFGDSDRNITVSKVSELYLSDLEARLGRHSAYISAEKHIRLYINPELGRCKIRQVSLNDWQSVINKAKPHTKDKEALSEKSLKNLRAAIVQLHKFAYNNYFCDDWRGSLYIPAGRSKKEKEILQPSEIKRLFEPSELIYAPAFKVMLICGLRPSECLGLQLDDIGDGVLYIRRGVNDFGEITGGKNKNARRIVPLPPLARQIIDETIKRNQEKRFHTKWIFCSCVGDKGNQNSMRKDWNRLKTQRALSGTPYSLRHTFISIVSSQTQISAGTLKELVGHSETMDTFGFYKHRVAGEFESVAQVIDLTFKSLTAEQ